MYLNVYIYEPLNELPHGGLARTEGGGHMSSDDDEESTSGSSGNGSSERKRKEHVRIDVVTTLTPGATMVSVDSPTF